MGWLNYLYCSPFVKSGLSWSYECFCSSLRCAWTTRSPRMWASPTISPFEQTDGDMLLLNPSDSRIQPRQAPESGRSRYERPILPPAPANRLRARAHVDAVREPLAPSKRPLPSGPRDSSERVHTLSGHNRRRELFSTGNSALRATPWLRPGRKAPLGCLTFQLRRALTRRLQPIVELERLGYEFCERFWPSLRASSSSVTTAISRSMYWFQFKA